MGGGSWSSATYRAAETYRTKTGTSAFAYSDAGHRTVHDQMDPSKLGAMGYRESRDSTEHPQSLALMVMIDVTGSMRNVPRVMQKKLPDLHQLLVDKGYVTDPQILFGAIGDATCDQAPLQVGQFESDNRSDEDLGKLVLEGGGGGGMRESYELALYFAARKTSLDCLEKRDHRGYLFIIGDEMAYDYVSRTEVKKLIGDELSDDIPTREILTELQDLYNVFFILPEGASHIGESDSGRQVKRYWKDLLGQHVIELNDLDKTCELIATTIQAEEEAAAVASTPAGDEEVAGSAE